MSRINKDSKRFKGNLHSHTTNSDGHLTVEESKALYKKNGFSFIAFTDHDIFTDYSNELNDEDFIILPATEASANLVDPEIKRLIKTHHMLAIKGTKEMIEKSTQPIYKHGEKLEIPMHINKWEGLKVAQDLVNDLKSRGLFVVYNHPVWSRVRLDEFCDLEGIIGVETFNYNTVNECALGADFIHYDEMLRAGRKVFCLATDDNHNDGTFKDSCGGYIVVFAENLTHEEITSNIIKGNFYSSSGVDIEEFDIKDNTVYVKCSDVNRINFIADGNVGDGRTVMCDEFEETLNFAEYKLKGSERSIRVECIDKYGQSAWTNPIYL